MKRKLLLTALIPPLFFSGATQADVIYSNLQDISIPGNFDGVYLNVLSGNTSGSEFTGWHVNPIFGGVGFLNSPDFQALRETNTGDGTISNISIGEFVGSSSSFYATGFGGSDAHLGNTFTAGQDGYIGFSVNNDSATHYGWMRVIFNGAGSSSIRDWAYDTSVGEISVGGIRQVGQDILLSTDMTVASNLANSGGITNLVMNHGGTTSLTGTNIHTGETVISQGTLSINGTSSINNSNLTLDGGTLRYNSSVDYDGTFTFTEGMIGGTNLNGSLDNLVVGPGQILSPGTASATATATATATTGSQTWGGGGTYLMEINDTNGTAGVDFGWDLLLGSGTLTIAVDQSSPFIIAVKSLGLSGIEGEAASFNDFSNYNWLIADFTSIQGFAEGAFVIDTTGFENPFTGVFGLERGDMIDGGNDGQLYLTYTAIPEPRAAWLSLLGLAALLARRRKK